MRKLRLIVGWTLVASAAGWMLMAVAGFLFGDERAYPQVAMSAVFAFAALAAGVGFHPGDRPDDG